MHLNDVLDQTEFVDSLEPGEFYQRKDIESNLDFISSSRPLSLSDPFKTTISYIDCLKTKYRFLKVDEETYVFLYKEDNAAHS